MTARIEKTVFISYRRTNFYTALAVYQDLTAHGYDVFFDFQSIDSGDFEKIITENIKAKAHFLIILSSSALERCSEPGDWLRREIEMAMDEKRNIVPLMMEGFDFGSPSTKDALSGKLSTLNRYNGLRLVADYFFEGMEKLRERYLKVAVEDISLQPVSAQTKKITETQKVSVNEAALVKKKQLTAEEWFERGYLYSEDSNFKESIRCYSKAISLKPDFDRAYANRGYSIIENEGNLNQALKDLNKAIELDPKDYASYNNRGRIYSMRRKLEDAIENYSLSIKHNRKYEYPYYNRGIDRISLGDLNNAIIDLKKAIDLAPKDENYHSWLGTAYIFKGKIDEAIAEYNIAVHLNTKNSESYYYRGNALSRKGDNRSAIRDLRKALKLESNDINIQASLLRVLKLLGHSQEAKKLEKNARKQIKKENEYNQACFEAICGNIDNALQYLKIGLVKKQVSKAWARQDPDLENIRSTPRFKELVGE